MPLSLLMTAKERKEIIDAMYNYFCDSKVSSDPRISCKFLHYIVLYSSLEFVFDDSNYNSYFESTYLN